MKYTIKGGLIWLQGTLGYILVIAFLAIKYPNNDEILLRLADHVFPFFVYGWGFTLMGVLFDISNWVLKKVQRSSGSET